jgi:hypothetical protein
MQLDVDTATPTTTRSNPLFVAETIRAGQNDRAQTGTCPFPFLRRRRCQPRVARFARGALNRCRRKCAVIKPVSTNLASAALAAWWP